jgi:HAD superfamily hydrolase (TIGR01549 family)
VDGKIQSTRAVRNDVWHPPRIVRSVRGIIFDMDGTLIDSAAAVPDAYIATIAAGGGPELTRSDVVAAYVVGAPAAMLTHLLGRSSTRDDLATYHERLQALARDVVVYPGVRDALVRLGSRLPLGVFTGASITACRILLGATGLLDRFTTVLGSDEVAHAKPYPDGIIEACRRIGVAPQDAAYVGDSPRDLLAARRSGTLAVAAAWGHEYDPGEPSDAVLHDPLEILTLFGDEA